MSISLSILIPVRDEEENVKIISNDIITKINLKKYEIIFCSYCKAFFLVFVNLDPTNPFQSKVSFVTYINILE